MIAAIDRFAARVALPEGLEYDERKLDDVFGVDIPAHLGAALRRSWTPDLGLCRIDRLRVRVDITARDLLAGRLPEVWSQAATAALFEALARQEHTWTKGVVRASTRAAWLARAVEAALDGHLGDSWEFAEFAALASRPRSLAVEGILTDWGEPPGSILLELHRRGTLVRVLDALDTTTLQRLATLPLAGARPADGLTPREVARIGRAALSLIGERDRFDHPRTALRVFAEMARAREPGRRSVVSSRWSPNAVFVALVGLGVLSEYEQAVGPSDAPAEGTLRSDVVALLRRIGYGRAPTSSGSETPQSTELDRVVERLRERAGSGRRSAAADWIVSDAAGLFVLCDVIERCGWPRIVRNAFPGLRASAFLSFFLIGLGDRLLRGGAASLDRVDLGLARFGGCEGAVDVAALNAFLEADDPGPRLEILVQALVDPDPSSASSWDATFAELADAICRDFASTLRGLEASSPDFVIDRFLRRRGRLRVEPNLVDVELSPGPLDVVLRVSGVDRPTRRISWLADRALRIRLGGG